MIVEILIIFFLMITGIILVLLEIFMLPGVLTGIAGILFASGGIWYAYSIAPWLGHSTLLASLVVFLFSFIWLLRSKSFSRVALKTDVDSRLVSSRELGIHPGDEGITVSRLAPIGKAKINEIMVEAKSQDELIDEKIPIEVVRVDGYNVIVKKKETNIHN